MSINSTYLYYYLQSFDRPLSHAHFQHIHHKDDIYADV